MAIDITQFEDMSKAEGQKFLAYYKNEYSILHPSPVKGENAVLDWKFYALLVSAIAIVIVAALRTAQMFYFMEQLAASVWGLAEDAGITILFSWTGALLSMVGFEGGLAVLGAVKAAEKDIIEDWKYNLQVGLLLTISIFAGLGQSMGLIPSLDETYMQAFSIILVIVVGLGASVGSWIAGEIVGIQIKKFHEAEKAVLETFSAENAQHIKFARKFWKERTENDKREQREKAEKERQNATVRGANERQEAVFTAFETIRENHLAAGNSDLPGVQETLNWLQDPANGFSQLGLKAKSNISKLRQDWLAENPDYIEKEDDTKAG